MKKQTGRDFKHLIMFGANFILLLLETVLFAMVWIMYYLPASKDLLSVSDNVIVIGLYMLLQFMFVRGLGGNRIGYRRIIEMWLSQTIALILTSIVIYAEICIIARGYVSFWPLVVIDTVEVLFVLVWIYLVRVLYLQLYPPRDMLVIYERAYPEELITKINLSKDEFHHCQSINTEEGEEILHQRILKADAVILSDITDETRNSLIKFCYDHGIRAYVTPKISDLILRGAEDVQLFYTPLLLSRNHGLNIEQRVEKRIFDLLVASVGLVLASPLLLFAAIGIKCCDGGPIFYRQKRLTRGGASFQMIKLRSMYVNAESKGARLAAKNDSRVTPVGKVLRRFHIDELPQLVNVLKGEMSIVGPRPERKEIADKYTQSIPEFTYRLKVKAGLTGYAQVNGKYNSTPYDKLKLDITYIEQYSIWMDIKILLWTVKALIQSESTEGVDEDQTTAMK